VKPLVSIVIPVYNGCNYIREAIDSALMQTYDCIEVIVVNDGSDDFDETERIALSFGDKIRYFSKPNGGVSSALNMGIDNMRGEYFSWLSHDDLYKPEKIKLQIDTIVDDPMRIVYSDYSVIDKDGRIIVTMDIKKKYPDADLTVGLFPILRQVLNGCSLLIHKNHFESTGLFDEELRVTQDYDLWFKMFRNQKLGYINVPLVMMREHRAQVTHNYEHNRAESDKLWLNMLENITATETCELNGTELDFWNKQTEFLLFTRYKNAKLYAKNRLRALGGGTISLAKFIRLGIYRTLSGLSQLTRRLGIQKVLKKSPLLNLGYKMWFEVKYK